MNINIVANAIIEVVTLMEQSFGKTPPSLGLSDVPEDKCSEFDSKMWPIAIGRISRLLGIKIPKEVAVFGRRNGASMTVEDSAEKICQNYQPRANRIEAAG